LYKAFQDQIKANINPVTAKPTPVAIPASPFITAVKNNPALNTRNVRTVI